MRFGTNFSVLRILSSSRGFAWYPDNHSFFLLLIAPKRVDSHCATHEVQRDIPGFTSKIQPLPGLVGGLSTHLNPEYGSGWLIGQP